MNHRPHLLALVALTLTLAGCGQKGPLYLPDTKAGEIVTRPAPTQGTEATAPPAESAPAPTPVDESEKDKKNGPPPPK